MTQKTNPWTFDVRVRERTLKAGSLTDKDVEKYLTALPDLAAHTEAFGISQPALAQPPSAHHTSASRSAGAAVVGESAPDDDSEDDEDEAEDGTAETADEAPSAAG